MITPFDTPPATFVLSKRQATWLKHETAYRAAMFRLIGDEDQAARVLAATFTVTDEAEFQTLLDRMRAANAEMQDQHSLTLARTYNEIFRYLNAQRNTGQDQLTEGLYDVGGDIYKIVKSKTSNRLYAKILDMETGSFEYAAGAMKRIDVRDRMSLDEAKAYGRRTGTCVVCGRHLTNPVSVAEGIGPVCSGRV